MFIHHSHEEIPAWQSLKVFKDDVTLSLSLLESDERYRSLRSTELTLMVGLLAPPVISDFFG